MKLLYFGTPSFAVPPLEAVMASTHQLCAVVTQPPKPAGRGYAVTHSPVQACAEQHGLPVLTPASLKNEEAQALLRAYDVDVGIVCAYGKLLPPAILEMFPHGCLNIHPSLLPRYRGPSPIQAALLGGDAETGVTIMQLDEGMDSGDILLQEKVPLRDDVTGGALHDQLSLIGARMMLHAVDQLAQGRLIATPQNADQATFCAKIEKESGHIRWEEEGETIARKVRALHPWPGTFFIHQGDMIKMHEAHFESSRHSYRPGEVSASPPLGIACKGGIVYPRVLQRPGRKPQAIDEFLRGYKIAAGTMLE